MSEDFNDSDYQQQKEILAYFIPIFGKAKWITGKNASFPETFYLNFTPLGQKRMRQMAECSKSLLPHMWGKTVADIDGPELAAALAMSSAIALELKEWNLNEQQKNVLFGLAIVYVRKWITPDHGGPEIPDNPRA